MKVKIDNSGKKAKSLLQRMEKSDWMFLIGYVFFIFILAILLDSVLNLIDGGVLVIIGTIMGGVILRNRLFQKSQKSNQ